jgi:hypothetical protein
LRTPFHFQQDVKYGSTITNKQVSAFANEIYVINGRILKTINDLLVQEAKTQAENSKIITTQGETYSRIGLPKS